MAVQVYGSKTLGRLEDCEVWNNARGGIHVSRGNPTIIGCTIRDHVGAAACGLFLAAEVYGYGVGNATVGAGNVFARNAGGDVVRQERPAFGDGAAAAGAGGRKEGDAT